MGGAVYFYSKIYSALPWLFPPPFAVIKSCTFVGNSASNGGAIYSDVQNDNIAPLHFNSLIIIDSTFTDNMAKENAGAIFDNFFTTIIGSSFTGNTANQYGGAIFSSGRIQLKNSIVTENFGHSAIKTKDGSISRSTITNNLPVVDTSESNSGIGIFVDSNLGFIISKSNIFGHNPYDIFNNNSKIITAAENYWGTTVKTVIDLNIFDNNDDSVLGEVLFTTLFNSQFSEFSSIAIG